MIRPPTHADLPAIRSLLQENRHRFLTCGLEDLPALLAGAGATVGVTPGDGTDLWGFVAFDAANHHAAPGSLQDGALRAAAIGRHLPAGASEGDLFSHAIAALQGAGRPFQLTALSNESWLGDLLAAQGFALADHLYLYQRSRRSVPVRSLPVLPLGASLHLLGQTELPDLHRLDNAAFPPLWRMAAGDLLELCFTSRVQTAKVDGKLAGYAAVSLYPAQDRHDDAHAQLTRLAIHPNRQRQGIGRQLLIDSIAYAHANDCYRILLNTPASNPTAQHLYESLHFRRHGARLPVWVYTWP